MTKIATSPVDLYGLPRDTIILTEQGGFWQKRGTELWFEPGNSTPSEAWDLTFPAEIIYRPRFTR